MTLNEYREVLHEDIALAASADMSTPEEEFLRYVTDILVDGENSMIVKSVITRVFLEEKPILE